jgi:plastocyanin
MGAAVAALALAAGAALSPGVLAAEGSRVLMVDNEPDLTRWHFEPADLTVPPGATVVWHNGGQQDHTVTANDKSFDSGTKPPGADWQRTFSKPGEFAYHCAPHPWMTGVVRVVAGGAALPPTTTTSAIAETTTTMPPVATTASEAAPAGGGSSSGGGLAGTIALVGGLTAAALALGARLRRSRS